MTISTFCLLLTMNLCSALKCYDCESTSTDDEPICDRLYWKQLDAVKWADLSVDCIHSLSAFCIVTWQTAETTGVKTTKRGCMGAADSQGTRLNAGCIEISENEKTCLCTDNLCNSSPTIIPSSFLWISATILPILTAFITS